jgi:hypothetical protein
VRWIVAQGVKKPSFFMELEASFSLLKSTSVDRVLEDLNSEKPLKSRFLSTHFPLSSHLRI